jgi:stringent starvation protein B
MLSNKPYLIRAFNDWIVDSNCTPILVVDATVPRCVVPQDYIENGEIILNISPDAIRELKITATVVEFKASFSGIAYTISVPVRAVLAVYAEENGQGMFFDIDHDEDDGWGDDAFETVENESTATAETTEKKKPHLTLVE